MSLVSCPVCRRHVRRSEKCVFCGSVKVAVVALAVAGAVACQKEIAQPYGVPMPQNDGRDAAANPMPADTAGAVDGGASK